MGIGKIPTLNTMADTTAWCSLSYKSKDSIETFDMIFDVFNKHMTQQLPMFTNKNGKNQAIQEMVLLDMDSLLEQLEKLKLKILSLIDIGKDIKTGSIIVKDVDYNVFLKANEDTALYF